jgi:hypothetical protein
MRRSLIIAMLSLIVLAAIYLGLRLHNNSATDKIYKTDYFRVNQIKYGLLSGDKWTLQVNTIISKQIDSFGFNGQNKQLLEKEINKILERLFDEADVVLHKERKNPFDRIKYKIINSFVDVNEFKKEIPRFSKAIIDELDKSKNKDQFKDMLKEKVGHILSTANQDSLGEQQSILKKYGASTLEEFNSIINEKTIVIKKEQQLLGYSLIGLLVLVLLIWLYIFKTRWLYAATFLFSVIISFVALFIGVSLPMIEIDARISRLDLEFLSSHIIFEDQVIFFQAKSILDVVHILLRNGKADTVFVGILILTFSVLFPVTKLISTTLYLFNVKRNSRFIRFMAFNSGKWSMADVMVVAIFMAYVGFQRILDDQLEDISLSGESMNLVTTNRTNLQTGFIIFVSFCLFNLILAEILKYITKLENKDQSK